eukprot:714272_1
MLVSRLMPDQNEFPHEQPIVDPTSISRVATHQHTAAKVSLGRHSKPPTTHTSDSEDSESYSSSRSLDEDAVSSTLNIPSSLNQPISSLSPDLSIRRSSAPAALLSPIFENTLELFNKNRRGSEPSKSKLDSGARNEAIFLSQRNKISLNVGGSIFVTTLHTLQKYPDTMFAGMFSGRFNLDEGDDGKGMFIDRDPHHFRHILNFLRDGFAYLAERHMHDLPLREISEILREARFYSVRPLIDHLEDIKRVRKSAALQEPTREREYKFVPNVPEDEIEHTFYEFTANRNFDFDDCIKLSPSKKGSRHHYHMVFSKFLSHGEVNLLDKLAGVPPP